MEDIEKLSRRDWDSMSFDSSLVVESVDGEKRELILMLLDCGCCWCF